MLGLETHFPEYFGKYNRLHLFKQHAKIRNFYELFW